MVRPDISCHLQVQRRSEQEVRKDGHGVDETMDCRDVIGPEAKGMHSPLYGTHNQGHQCVELTTKMFGAVLS